MGPPSYMRSVVDWNVVMRRIPVYLTNVTCGYVPSRENGKLVRTCIVHLPVSHRLSLNVTQIDGINSICWHIKAFLVVFPRVVYSCQTSDLACRRCYAVRPTNPDEVHDLWESDHNNQANVWQVCPSTIVCWINHSWVQYHLFWRHAAQPPKRTYAHPGVKPERSGNTQTPGI